MGLFTKKRKLNNGSLNKKVNMPFEFVQLAQFSAYNGISQEAAKNGFCIYFNETKDILTAVFDFEGAKITDELIEFINNYGLGDYEYEVVQYAFGLFIDWRNCVWCEDETRHVDERFIDVNRQIKEPIRQVLRHLGFVQIANNGQHKLVDIYEEENRLNPIPGRTR